MAEQVRSKKVVVVGGGVLGVSTATQLAEAGASVTVITESGLTSGASGRSLSWLNSAARRSPEYHLLRVLGIDRYRTLFARQPGASWLRFDGALSWGGPEGADQVRALHEYQRSIGYDSVWVTADEIPAIAPGVDPKAVPADGATFNPGEGWVDLPSLVSVLASRLTDAGGVIVENAGPVEVVTKGDRVVGARTPGGVTYVADAVLLATGANVPRMLAELGSPVDERTPISVLAHTEPLALPLKLALNTPRASLRPTPDGRLAVDSGWVEDHVSRHADGAYEVPGAVVRELLLEASAVLEGHPELRLASVHIGPKPIPGDGEPVLGAITAVDGLYTAFTHSGATLGLIAGELLAAEILSGQPHPLLAKFTAARFASTRRAVEGGR
ncbi:FAD-binding oxidoreductase [Amycolatopsis sp.]|uniref:NAD(P)/FAD-dependent oxidoreductase n=1 Tax=Amycolatopsis sp. TaxID=37632 RepID=UPI002CBACD32|nr:FAD-binding oxidoreductase [Amycolatopsis sp.]HVV11450.1 FAD-binding oxidoreductase [Amycolatopsis sp.]